MKILLHIGLGVEPWVKFDPTFGFLSIGKNMFKSRDSLYNMATTRIGWRLDFL